VDSRAGNGCDTLVDRIAMTTPSGSAARALRHPTSPWLILGLLGVSVLINYMDRGNLSAAAPVLIGDLHLNEVQMGVLLSSFFWTYALFQLPSGWLVDRFDVTKLYALGYLVWTLATLATGLVPGFAVLLALRLLVGLAESIAYPAYSKILSEHFKDERRGLANGIIDVGTKFGMATANLLGGWMIAGFGWRFFFLSTGAVTLLWLLPWLRYAPSHPPAPPQPSAAAATATHDAGWLAVLGKRAAWTTFVGLFLFNYVWYFLLTWLPGYLRLERKFSLETMAVFSAFPLVVTAAMTIGAGLLSDRLIARGAATAVVRRRFLIIGLLVIAATLPLATVKDDTLAMTALVAAFAGLGVYTANCWAFTQHLAGLDAVGKWTGIQNCVGNLGGVVAPVTTGFIVNRLGSFRMAFVAAAAVALLGAIVYRWMLGRPEPADWRKPAGGDAHLNASS
jgi:ACS family D-galactonate transporter-like MFS transporter